MVQNPHVLQRAQAELDDVLGSCIDSGVRLGWGLGSSLASGPASSSGSEASQGFSLGSGAGPESVAQRIPGFKDRAGLPYCDAVLTETLRWGVFCPSFYASFASTPSSFHRPSFHDVYHPSIRQLRHSPPQPTRITNVWAIMRDHGLYRELEVFEPRRWLRGEGKIVDVSSDMVVEGRGREAKRSKSVRV